MNSYNKYYFALTVLFLLVTVLTIQAQPPPPPPPTGPPCWPPPCVPVDGGITIAIGAAVAFGGKKLYDSFRSESKEE
ncbi:MAG: hypothetical protein Fur0041_15740 [Bacteroidia bacterium]